MSQPPSEGFVYVNYITLIQRWKSRKTFNHIVLQSGSFEREIPTRISHKHPHKEEFNPPLELSVQDKLSLSMRYSDFFGRHKLLSIDVVLSEVNAGADNGNKTYTKVDKDIEAVIGISFYPAASTSLHDEPSPEPEEGENDVPNDLKSSSATAEILRICPRFRLLVIGDTGVGKSTLIQKVFGVTDVDVSEYLRGRANIDREFIAKENGLFVLHDSVGLEAGDSKNMKEIKRFIHERRNKEALRDRLHAVWVCLAVPYAKGRLLEAGMEEFLRNRKKILGDIPIVVVLTKLDLLDVSLRSRGVTMQNLEEARTNFLQEYCANPLARAGAGEIRQVPVSTMPKFGLESTVSDLVKTTTSEIERYVRTDPSSYAVTATMAKRSSLERDAPIYIAGMAQRASIEEKVNLTITLGKTRYWRNLSISFRFSSEKVKEHILLVHKEIVDIWNFNDPGMALRTDDFKTKLLDAPNLGAQDIRSLRMVLSSLTSLAALGPLITSVPHAVVVAAPAVGVAALGLIFLEIYKSAKTIVKRFMAYIVDLVYVMKILFILAPSKPITSQDVDFALEVYKRSPYRNCVHLLIKEFDVDLTVLGNCDTVMQTIEDVIRQFSITDKQVAELRREIEAAQDSAPNAK